MNAWNAIKNLFGGGNAQDDQRTFNRPIEAAIALLQGGDSQEAQVIESQLSVHSRRFGS